MPTFKWATAHEWLKDRLEREEEIGSSWPRNTLDYLIAGLDNDQIQDGFQDDMDDDGFFKPDWTAEEIERFLVHKGVAFVLSRPHERGHVTLSRFDDYYGRFVYIVVGENLVGCYDHRYDASARKHEYPDSYAEALRIAADWLGIKLDAYAAKEYDDTFLPPVNVPDLLDEWHGAEARKQAEMADPLGPGWPAEITEDIDRLELRGENFNDPGANYVVWRAYYADGRLAASQFFDWSDDEETDD
jgi:hypothetical protein